jgi:beta-mannanase
METPLTDYSWSGKNPKDYIAAWNHFVKVARSVAPQVKFIWCPEGEENCADFWPGSDTVDAVGLEIYSYADYDVTAYGQPRTFKDQMDERYGRVATIDTTKPVIICELAAFSIKDSNYGINWIKDAFAQAPSYDRIIAILLYSGRDPVAWGKCPPPNFTLPSVPAVTTASAAPTPSTKTN